MQVGENGLLHTRDSVPYYGTYPRMRVPSPLQLRPYECETSLADIAAEMMAHMKLNWNSTQLDGKLSIPIRAAREVGRVLKHVSYGERDQTDFRYYTSLCMVRFRKVTRADASTRSSARFRPSSRQCASEGCQT